MAADSANSVCAKGGPRQSLERIRQVPQVGEGPDNDGGSRGRAGYEMGGQVGLRAGH